MKDVSITKKFAILLLLLFCLPALTDNAWAAWRQSAGGSAYPVTSMQLTLPNVQAGSLLVIAVRMSASGQTSTVTSPGATWTRDAHSVQRSLGTALDVHSAPNVPGGNTTITISVTGSANSIRVIAHEYTGMATSNPAHKVAIASGTSSAINAGSVTTTINGCTLFAAAATDSDLLGWGAGSGYTFHDTCNVDAEPWQKLCLEEKGPVAAGTWSGGFTINSDSWEAVLVAYAPSGSAPSPTPAAPSWVP